MGYYIPLFVNIIMDGAHVLLSSIVFLPATYMYRLTIVRDELNTVNEPQNLPFVNKDNSQNS